MHHPSAPLHILLVEQDEEIRSLFTAFFISHGHTVSDTGRAIEALDHVEQKAPDVIFSSLVFSDMNGADLCRRLRSMHQTSTSLIVALTGYAESHIEKALTDAGFDHYLLKPVQLQVVLDLVEKRAKEIRQRSLSASV